MTSSPPPPLHHHQINPTTVADGSSTTTSTTPWSCETNWTVTRGSLDSAVTFESFDFPIDSESSPLKPPLLLLPPSTSDFQPCEIKLNFTQKHEIHQVYVRSTARVYEIYYATDLQSENEYLCTVRCSAASVEVNLLPETDVKNAISVNLEGPNEILPKGRVVGENNVGTNEDDWVEIKLPVGRVDEGSSYSPKTTRNYQNCYEATAEINDSEPCISLTLRLLSLQSKAFVHVDEVYVFANPIDTDDSQNQTVNPETSAGTSLMTMLVPTLLGLSKSKSIQLPNQVTPKSIEEPVKTEPQPTPELTRCQVPASTSDNDKVPNALPDNRAEILLEQLVSRVSRIEDMMFRFEENMLKPINSIEVRLENLEQQVELLAKNSQPNPANSNQLCSESESEKQDHSDGVTPPPESPHSDEIHESNDVLESSKIEKPKKSVSINDALASALAGLSSSTKPDNSFPILPLESPEQCLKSNHDTPVPSESLNPTAPESPGSDEKHESNDVLETPKIEKPKKSVSINDALAAALAGFSSFTEPDKSFPILPLESPEQCLKSNHDTPVPSESLNLTSPEFILEENKEATKTTVTLDVLFNSEDLTTTYCNAPTDIPSDNRDDKTEDEIIKQDSIEAVKILTFHKNDILKYFPDQCPEVENVSESGVDSKTSILEVKFASMDNGNLKSHLEDFLSYTDDDRTIDEGVSIEETTGTGNENGLLVELDGDDVAESVMQDLTDVHVETSFDSLI